MKSEEDFEEENSEEEIESDLGEQYDCQCCSETKYANDECPSFCEHCLQYICCACSYCINDSIRHSGKEYCGDCIKESLNSIGKFLKG